VPAAEGAGTQSTVSSYTHSSPEITQTSMQVNNVGCLNKEIKNKLNTNKPRARKPIKQYSQKTNQ
jgi:hypothetical protein